MDDQALKQLALQKEKEWLAVMQERYFIFVYLSNKNLHSTLLRSRLVALESNC